MTAILSPSSVAPHKYPEHHRFRVIGQKSKESSFLPFFLIWGVFGRGPMNFMEASLDSRMDFP